ncbi:hypothetical protein [Lacipirellula limnantheis]|uniref:Uncharacterized protein n=1 Tax=Lacipirellula limnantheis TaxID=2528024 RepID=A0A517TVE8_9BACT|nr:hypothetical protein [Lacipirellula limnantheis]QDT72341.1 hypothetical protein I41_15140 [Lacipirellula limnantheis]
MPKKKKKAAKLREKKAYSYGVIFLDQITPPIPVNGRKPIEIDMTMDEALKLHLGLLQALTELNRLDRRSPMSRARGIRFSLYPDQNRMMIEQGSVQDNSAPR